MSRIISGVIAGVVATVVLSVIMFLKNLMGVMPELDVIAMLAKMLGAGAAVGWLMHFMVGIGYGGLFHVTNTKLPGTTQIGKGILLGLSGWLVMMLLLLPMMGVGVFGMKMGPMAPMMTLVFHVIFGAVLGSAYSELLTYPQPHPAKRS